MSIFDSRSPKASLSASKPKSSLAGNSTQVQAFHLKNLRDDSEDSEISVEFRLVYQGQLYGNSASSKHKQEIRRYLHKQLQNVWVTKFPLKGRGETASYAGLTFRTGVADLAKHYSVGERWYVPIVCDKLALVCA